MSKCITIYTDASHCPRTKVSAWGCWIKFGLDQKIECGGFFKDNCHNAVEAELKAIANALTVVMKTLKPKDKILVVVTDCLPAMVLMERGKFSTKPSGSKAQKKATNQSRITMIETAKMIKKLVPKDCELRLNKVKAHSNSDGKRSYVNNRVDEIAKSHMKKRRSELAFKAFKA